VAQTTTVRVPKKIARAAYDEVRKRAARNSLYYFIQTYLVHHLKDQKTGEIIRSADFHKDLCLDAQLHAENGGLMCRAAPRGHAKTTIISLGLPLWCLCFAIKKHIIISSDTEPNTSDIVHNIVDEFKTNALLLADFGDAFTINRRPGTGRAEKDTGRDVAFKNGARLRGIQFHGKIRGKKHRWYRPDLIILDDVENDTHVENQEIRDKGAHWIDAAAISSLSPSSGTVIFIGTILHSDSVLARKMGNEEWNSYKYKAIFNGNQILWPEMWSTERLNKVKARIGAKAFSQEFLNEPIDLETRTFRPEYFGQFEHPHFLGDPPLERKNLGWMFKGAPCKIILVVDPASRKRKNSDYSAVALMGSTYDGKHRFLIDVLRDRFNHPELKRQIVGLWRQWGPISAVVVETVAYQKALAEDLTDLGLPVIEVGYCRDDSVWIPQGKEERISSSSLFFTRDGCKVWINVRSDSVLQLRDRMLSWPAIAFDDDIDAFCIGLHFLQDSSGPSGRVKAFGGYRDAVAVEEF